MQGRRVSGTHRTGLQWAPLFAVLCLLLFGPGSPLVDSTRAASSFAQDYGDTKGVSSTARVSIDVSAREATLQPNANTLPDGGTLLFTSLESDADVTAPVLARGGGGSSKGVTFTSGGGGQRGEAAAISGRGHAITFPAPGNFDPLKGTIDFWMSLSNWSLDANGHTSDHPHDQVIFHAADGDHSVQLARDSDGNLNLQFREGRKGVFSGPLATGGFAAGSWHHFTFTWNVEEDVFYIASWLDGVYQGELADPAPNTFDPATFGSFHPRVITIGNRSDGHEPLNGKLDDLRITATEYSTTPYSGRGGIVTSAAMDTRVQNPVWGAITWNETLSPKTDIELQTSTSADGSHWTAWFPANRAMFSVTFDDGYSSVYDTAYPIMKKLGLSGVAFVTTGWVGERSRMTLGQLQHLQREGWEIGGHGSKHVINSREEFAESKAWLMSHELGHTAFAYPGGIFDQAIISDISEYYATARTVINQYQTYAPRYALYNYAGNSGPDDVNSWIDSVVAKKAWGILTFHAIGQPGTEENVPHSDFAAIVQYLADRRLDVLTVDDALARLTLYTNHGGEQIAAANRRFIRYRAILHSFDGTHTPTLSGVVLSAPTKLYRGIAATIDSNGSYDHATWPQTTDLALDEFVVTPDDGSVSVQVDTWESSGLFRRKWTEAASRADAATNHSMGNLVPGNHYRVEQDGSVRDVYQADASGQIVFKCAIGPSTSAFEVGQATSGPSISKVSSTPSATEAKITWSTDEVATTAVDYGLTPSYGTSTTELDVSPGTVSHAVTLPGLRECTTYHFRVRSKGAAADAATAGGTFKTAGTCPRAPDEPTAPPPASFPWGVILSCGVVAAGLVLFVVSLRRGRSSSKGRRRRHRRE